MASRKQIIEKAHGIAPKVEPDLADEHDQGEILNPPGATITLGGKEAKIYPLSARTVRNLCFLMKEALADANGNFRKAVVIACDQYADRVAQFIALALFEKPDRIEQKQLAALRAEIAQAEDADPSGAETEAAFMALLEQNDVLGILVKAYAGVEDDGKKDA